MRILVQQKKKKSAAAAAQHVLILISLTVLYVVLPQGLSVEVKEENDRWLHAAVKVSNNSIIIIRDCSSNLYVGIEMF